MSTAPAPRRAPTEAEARALASTLRLRILRACIHQPRTNREIAALVGRDPGSTLHHVRTLVDTGFLVAEPARRGARGAREIPYRATMKSWQLDGSAGEPSPLLETFLEDVRGLSSAEINAARLGVRLAPAVWEDYLERIQAILDEIAARPSDPDGTAMSIFFAAHPDPLNPP